MKKALNFDNTKTAFSLKSDFELKQAQFLFSAIGISWLTAMAKPVTNFLFKVRFPIGPILKNTVFKHFCGGETIAECKTLINKLYDQKGVSSILDYSVEGKESEAQFNNSVRIVLEAFEFAKKSKATPFLVFKGTGLGRFELFRKVSSKATLNPQEKEEWQRVKARFDHICKTCATSKSVMVMIDAEESWIQDAIDEITEEMMATYNQNRAVVYNTVQLYRWDRLSYLKHILDFGKANNCMVGVKLVRGAYMEKERERAQEMDYKSPICENKAASDTNFNDGLTFCLENLEVFQIFLGTHNEQSSLLLATLMVKNNIANNDNRVWFGQLYGMGDHISFNLSEEKYNTAKYLPFGPVKEVMPYLFRRAEENTSVGTQTSRELQLVQKELKRRSKK